jgi:hypothetical protein
MIGAPGPITASSGFMNNIGVVGSGCHAGGVAAVLFRGEVLEAKGQAGPVVLLQRGTAKK